MDLPISFSKWRREFITGRSGPPELIRLLEANFARVEPTVHAFATSDWSAAKGTAEASARRYAAGTPLSSIDGLPFAAKDIIETAAFPTQMNSPIFTGFQSRRNALCVQRLIRQGAILVGKTVTQEFACGDAGPTTNPHDVRRTPGGSSSGSAAAVAAAMVPVALGTQTRASTIRPASFCGVLGMKPSMGLVPVDGIHPVAASQDTIGLLAGNLDDLQLLAAALGIPVGANWSSEESPISLLAVKTDGSLHLEPQVLEVFDEMLHRLSAAGIAIIDADS
jgi:Asp-tRNA(Asn)/Glu-tRNA(Gln) amidotransferase A subunit family amidase